MSVLIKGMEKPKSCESCPFEDFGGCMFRVQKEDCPLVEVTTPHGRWLDDNRRPKSSRFVCSVCGEVAYYPQNHRSDKPRACGYPYCPNCGALMDKEEGETNG